MSKVTQYRVTLARLRCKQRKKKSQNIISFRGVVAPTGHIYKLLIEKPRDHLDSNLFSLTRWAIFADHSGRRFCKFYFVQLYESKNVTLTFQGHGI